MNNAANKVRIEGYVVGGSYNTRMTPKAIYVTVYGVDGEQYSTADSCWLPRSIAENVQLKDDGEGGLEITALVPAWWVAKLDNRPGWVRRGELHAPYAQRPF